MCMIIFMKELIYQKFILGCQNLDDALKKGLGGVIFFTKDIKTTEQFKDLIKSIKSKSKIPPFLSIDQEGGRVERTENLRPKRESARFAFLKGEDFLKNQAEEISKELVEYGVNLNFAPCIDVNSNPNNPIIGERAFSDKTSEVIEGAKIFSEASKKYGIIPCYKHFPGHGDANKDSHLVLPEINLPFDEMKKTHIKPFAEAVKNGADMIMAAHLHCTCFDKEAIPTSLSKNAIGYLRKTLNYDGVIISDDMVMKGVEKYNTLDAVIAGIDAGLDMFIFRSSDDKTLNMIDELCKKANFDKNLREKIVKSNERISRLKSKYNIQK